MDDDDKEPEDEPPEPAGDAAQEEGAKLRKVSEEELEQILAAHETWLETRGERGKQANLSRTDLQRLYLDGANLQGAILIDANLQGTDLFGANLQKASLYTANFQRAILIGANLQEADLTLANLQGADLEEANLQGADLSFASLQGTDLSIAKLQEAILINTTFERLIATEGGEPTKDLEAADLTGANFRDADLSDAKLSDVTGLLADKLAGANLSNAKLPPDIAAFDGLARVEETSRIARPIFIGILAGCVYSWLTIATTTDVRLLINSASSPLPIIGTEIPIAGFYWVAPILLIGVYLYLHLYLQRLWEGLADLPAVFPDGKPLNKKVYPWLLSGLVRAHFKLLKGKRPLLSRLENWAAIFLAWWIVPVTVLLFWLRYLPRHEWIGTGLHVALLLLSIGSAILFHRHAAATLRRDVTAFRWRRPWSDRRTYQGAVAVGLGAAVALVSFGAIEGDVRRLFGIAVDKDMATWVPYAFDRVGYRTFANLREADVSTKPATWTGLAERPPEELEKLDKTLLEKARAELALVKGAPLPGADLRHANAVSAFLAKANLRGAKLQRAELADANLQGAELADANLQGAYLQGANLQGANLISANLQGADLRGAKLQGADLYDANLQGANLHGAYLQKARLISAKLQKANLWDANLQGADLNFARLQGAYLLQANLQGANLHGAYLQEANLVRADLEGADLGQAALQGTNFEGAYLVGADLYLTWGLTREQLDEACGDDETRLPDYLPDYQMKPCPTPEQSPSN